MPVRARNMCSKHYQRWVAANPELRMNAMIRKSILAALPAYWHQICEETGLEIQAVKRHLKLMQAEGAVHVGSYDPPDEANRRWKKIWHAGPGMNARVTERMRVEQRRKAQRKKHKHRTFSKLGWLGALGVAIQSAESEACE